MGFDNWGFVLELADTASELELIDEARCGSNTNVLSNRDATNVFDHAPIPTSSVDLQYANAH